MKNANGYGSVYKMHGSRRRPYIAAVTITIDGKRTRKAIGYYSSRRDDVHIDERYMIGGMKTDAGRGRTIPIAEKIVPIIKEFYNQENGDFLCPVHRYDRLREKWKMCALPVIHNHLPHDGRHTCETLLDNARVAKRTIQLILGHAGKDVDEAVYTHKTRQQLIDAINLI